MNTILISGLTILAATTPLMPAVSSADAACVPQVVQSVTRFPSRSQLRGQTGTVYIDVLVDETGRAQTARLHRSSGYRLLDRAATDSVIGDWLFDVSNCRRKDLPVNHLVAVEYRADPS